MAITKSGIYLQPVKDMLGGVAYTGGNINLTLATYRLALMSNAAVDGAGLLNFSSTTPTWGTANEVTGTNWASGGVLLSAGASGASVVPTWAEGTTGSLRYDHTNDLAVASTTLATGPRGCVIYADPVTAPYADPMLVFVNFGADYPTNNGTFAIQWSATGIFEIDLTP